LFQKGSTLTFRDSSQDKVEPQLARPSPPS